MVWDGLTVDEFRDLRIIDPRFDPGSKLVAIFKPTEKGWNMAIDLIASQMNYSREACREYYYSAIAERK